MKAAGFTVVRMGEFAWSTFEPTEGEFDFNWLERAIYLLGQNDIVSVLGTPTAAPPAWLAWHYPGTLAVDEHGHRREHGQRYHYCVNSPAYHQRTRSIVTQLAARFGPNPHVIGWQIDGGSGTVCYCDACRTALQQYLAEKFESLENLNEHWFSCYRHQRYASWAQIPLPKDGHNPGLMLAFRQFITHSYRKFQQLQADILRAHIPEQVWVTQNFTRWSPVCDHYEMSADLDLATWDWDMPSGFPDYREIGAAHDLVRGFKRRNFWLMETQPSNISWAPLNDQVRKGKGRAMAWHAVGHGADAALYWQWCAALNGPEPYRGAIIDQSGQPRPIYDEIAQLGAEFARVSELLAGSKVQAEVAILNDYDSRWSSDWQRQHEDFEYVDHMRHYHQPLAGLNIPVDIISADADLDGYRLVIAPGLVILTPERAQKITAFVGNGGTLILTLRSGMKDGFNALLPQRQPGLLAKIANVEVEESYLLEGPIPLSGRMVGNATSRLWAERLRIGRSNNFTQVVAKYSSKNEYLDGQIAITYNSYESGGVYYVGAYLDEHAQAKMLKYICRVKKVQALMETPPGLEVCRRVRPDGEAVYILINHRSDPKLVPIPWAATEHLSGFSGKGSLKIAPYGVTVLTQVKGRLSEV
jgi:beta-galactosidase